MGRPPRSMPDTNYAILEPHPALRPFVEDYWVQEDWRTPPPEGYPPTRLLPGGTLDLVIYYGDIFHYRQESRWLTEPRALVTGLRTTPVDVVASGKTGVLIARLRPWGVAAFFDDIGEWEEKSVELDAILPPALVRRLVERTAEATSSRGRVRAVEEFLLNRLGERTVDELSRRAAMRLWRSAGIPPVDQVAHELGISRRHLSRCFRRTIGTSPKRFASIARFQRAMADHRCGLTWSDVAATCGFTDQAHLVKEVRRFTGMTPTQLVVDGDTELFRRFNGATRPGTSAAPFREKTCEEQDPMSRIYKTIYAQAPSVAECIAI